MADRLLPSTTETRMAPGFRFRPTDEELISYYLKRKLQGKPMVLDLIGEVDVYQQEDPSQLPEQSRMKTKDQEWYFFTKPEKYGLNGYRKRSTTQGYWRDRGSERDIKRGGDGQVIGKVNRLVFNTGRPPKNIPTSWVIHEYHLVDNDGLGLKTDAYVLCRLSNTSGNINAPFSEQEWDDDGRALVPANEKIQQESNSRSMDLFDLNELPREFEMNDNPKTVDQDDDNNDASLPPLPFKRKRQTTHQDHCSSPKTISETIPSFAAAMLEESEPEPVDTMVPTTSSDTELIKDLQKEMKQMTVELEGCKLEINSLRMEIEELKKKNNNKER